MLLISDDRSPFVSVFDVVDSRYSTDLEDR